MELLPFDLSHGHKYSKGSNSDAGTLDLCNMPYIFLFEKALKSLAFLMALNITCYTNCPYRYHNIDYMAMKLDHTVTISRILWSQARKLYLIVARSWMHRKNDSHIFKSKSQKIYDKFQNLNQNFDVTFSICV